jgi:hypothetical protein
MIYTIVYMVGIIVPRVKKELFVLKYKKLVVQSILLSYFKENT